MQGRDTQDLIGGALLAVAGIWLAVHAGTHYAMGTVRQMGPGMFPAALGVLLALLGIAILVPALFRSGPAIVVSWRPAVAVLGAIVTFAILVDPLGVVPALMALVVVATLAGARRGALELVLLTLSLAGLALFVFRVLLGIPFQYFRWPL